MDAVIRPLRSAEVAGFYADGSVESGGRCPYCDTPPCRFAARPFVKRLPPRI